MNVKLGRRSGSLAFLRLESGVRFHVRVEFDPREWALGLRVREDDSSWRSGTSWLTLMPMFPVRIDWATAPLKDIYL